MRTGASAGAGGARVTGGLQVVRLDEFLAREAHVAQRADTVLDDAVVYQQVLADRSTDDHQQRLHQTVTLTQYTATVSTLRTQAPATDRHTHPVTVPEKVFYAFFRN